MGAVIITAIAQKETAKAAILKQLKDYGSTSAQMPGSVDVESDEARAALDALLAAGQVREARPGLYYLDESKAKIANPGNGFIALLALLIIISITASLVALAVNAG